MAKDMTKWRVALLGVAVAVVLGVLYMTFGKKLKQGFQSGSASGVDTFTLYYADWCGHCKKVKPEFQEFAASGEVDVKGKRCKVRMVNADENKEELKEKGVQGFPTFMLETADGNTVEYKGKRSTEGWLKFLEEELGMKQDVA